jgi:hypothetical protein
VTFTHYIAIDWSGAKGNAHKSIAVAMCGPDKKTPILVNMDKPWSRTAVLQWLIDFVQSGARPLIGFDFSFAPPFNAPHGYFSHSHVPKSARALWAYVDDICGDEDLGAASFVEEHHRAEFYLGKADGVKADYMRLRLCEQRFNAQGGGKPSSVFDCVGAAQVGKASFAGMRLLHQLGCKMPVWPFDTKPDAKSATGPLVVEIYTRAFIRHAGLRGLKVRDVDTLNAALIHLGSRPSHIAHALSDHQTDALIAAAGLRAIAGDNQYWQPKGLTQAIARTEGWTFGVA